MFAVFAFMVLVCWDWTCGKKAETLNAGRAIANLEKPVNRAEQDRWPKATRRVRAAASINPQPGMANGKC
jgi:hypothetical protein